MSEMNPLDAPDRAKQLRILMLSTLLECENQILSVRTSIRMAVYPQHGKDDEMIRKHVDAARYPAKETGSMRQLCFRST